MLGKVSLQLQGWSVPTGDGSVRLVLLTVLNALGVGMIASWYEYTNRMNKSLRRKKSKYRAERSPEEQELRLAVHRI